MNASGIPRGEFKWLVHYMLFYFQGKYNPLLTFIYRFHSYRVFWELKKRCFWATHVSQKWSIFPFSMPWCYQICILIGAMSPLPHARANENKLEKVNPTFSSSVGDFWKAVFIWDDLPENLVKITPQDCKKATSSWRALLKLLFLF